LLLKVISNSSLNLNSYSVLRTIIFELKTCSDLLIKENLKDINHTSASGTAKDTATELAIGTIEDAHIYDESENISNIDDDDPFINKNPVFVCQKPVQPILNFPINNQNRKFSQLFYEKYSWLEYSIKNDSVHCLTCRYFDKTLKKT
jgi:hypothetical protein